MSGTWVRVTLPLYSLRDDTVRCIVMSLTGQDGNDDLAAELELTTASDTLVDEDVEVSDYEDDQWMPDPTELDLCTDATPRSDVTT